MKNSLVPACVVVILLSAGVRGPSGQSLVPTPTSKPRSVPEPSTMLLIGAGAAAAIGARKLWGARRGRDRAADHRTREQ
jgi:hypothetical protein